MQITLLTTLLEILQENHPPIELPNMESGAIGNLGGLLMEKDDGSLIQTRSGVWTNAKAESLRPKGTPVLSPAARSRLRFAAGAAFIIVRAGLRPI
jgi:hypothetical protein